MKFFLSLCSLLTVLNLHAFEDYDPLSYEYGFPPPVTNPSECGKFFTSLDLLALSAATDSKIFGTEYIDGETIDMIDSVKRVYFPTSYDFGFKYTLGYDLPEDQWAASVSWMWYQSSQSAARSDGGFGSSRRGGVFFVPGINGIAPSADPQIAIDSSGNWKINFNQVDFLASKDFMVGPAFTINPSFGLRVLNLSEKVNFDSYIQSVPETKFLDSQLESHFCSCGPCIGVDCFVDLGFGLGGFIDARGALLVANQHNKQHLSAPFSIVPFDLSDVNFKNDAIGLKGALDFAVGLEWRFPVNCDMNFAFVRVAFENHVIFNATNYPAIDAVSMENGPFPFYKDQANDLALYGFSISFGLKI